MNKYTSFHEEPRVSFGSFTFAWEQRKLGEVVDVQCGKDYKHLSDGDIPVYGTGGYMLSVNKALSYNQDAIGIGRKGTIDKPYVLKAPFWTVDTLFYAIPKDNNKLDFLNCIFQNVDWKKKDESTGVPSLSKSTINDVDIFIPNENEQQSIGEYFCKLDHLITLHQRESELLCSVKHTKINKNKAYFTNVWEQRELSDYLEVSNEKNKNNIYDKNDVLSVSGDYGIVNQIEFQGRSFAGASVSNYGVVHTNDVVYTKSPLNANPYGIIKTNKGKTGIVSTLYAIYHPKKNTFSNFVQNYFEQHARMNNYMHPLVNKGAKNDMKVSSENALKGYVIFPEYDEQVAISTFFEELDNLITLHQRELEKLQNIKKSMLEKMFV